MQYLGNAYCQRSREYRYNWGKPKSLINHSYEKIAILNMHVRVCVCVCVDCVLTLNVAHQTTEAYFAAQGDRD